MINIPANGHTKFAISERMVPLMYKRTPFSLAILSLILLSQLAACASSDPDSNTVETTTNASDETSTVAEETSEYVSPGVDYEGETFTIAAMDLDMVYAVTNYTMISHDEETGDVINDAIVQMTRKVEEDLNVNLELYPLTNDDRASIDKVTRFIYAGEDEIQVTFPFTVALKNYLGTPSLLLDLNSIPTLDLSHSWWDQSSIEAYNIGGKQYTAVGDICFFAKCAPIVNFFNKQLLEEYSLDDPYEMVFDGTWTIDKMIELGRAAANDVNGNSTVDLDDTFGCIAESTSLGYFFTGAGIDWSKRDGDEITITVYNEKSMNIAEMLVPFFRDKTVTMIPNDYTGYTDVFQELFLPHFMANRSLFFSNQLLLALDFREMEADFGVLPLPKYDENQENYRSTTNDHWLDHMVVPATNARLELTGHVLDAMGYYSQQLVTPAFIETTVLDKTLRDENSEAIIEMIYDTQVYDIALAFNWGSITGVVSNMINNNTTNFSSLYASSESAILAAMDKTMEELLDT